MLTIAIAVLAFSTSATAQYSLTNQPSNTWYAYAGNRASIMNKKLPSDVMSHLYTSPQGVSGDKIAQWVLTAGYTQSPTGFTQWSTPQSDSQPGGDDMGTPIHYATSSDPWYWILPSGVSGGPTCKYLPQLNVRFHAPLKAHFSGGADQNIAIFDQAQQLLITLYRSSSVAPYNRTDGFPTCTATSASTACKLTSSLGATGCDVQRTDGSDRDSAWAGYETYGSYVIGGGDFAATAGVLRGSELMNGINHALLFAYACSNPYNPYVFPLTSKTALCGQNPNWLPYSSSAPPGGALLFLDYTDTQITNMRLPTWQTNILRAMAHYGGYLTITNGNKPLGPAMNSIESGQAWADAGHGSMGDPVYGWLENTEHIPCSGPVTAGSSECRFNLFTFHNIPANIPGPKCSSAQAASNQCGITKHVHIADPCVAKGLASQAGGCF